MKNNTFFCHLTGQCVSAIATFILFGDEYKNILEKIFIPKGKTKQITDTTILHGLIKSNNLIYDEAVIKIHTKTPAFPHFTYCEINVHGSPGIISALKKLFKSLNIHEVTKAGFLQYAFRKKYITYLEKELYHELFDNYSKKYTQLLLEEKRKTFLEHIKENIDNISYLINFLTSLLKKFTILKKFKKPVKVGIFGSTNAGKSTLFNCLLNTNRAITSPLPGTTRDYISSILHLKDYSIEFLDTAGFWESDDFINLKTKEITKKLWDSKNMLKLLVFAYDAPIPQELKFTDENTILVYNKIDVKELNNISPNSRKNIIQVSALKNINIDVLLDEIKKVIKINDWLNLSSPIIFTKRHEILINRMLQLLKNNVKSNLKFILDEIETGNKEYFA
ncbi:MAG: GTPase [Planctomycetota bacterium]